MSKQCTGHHKFVSFRFLNSFTVLNFLKFINDFKYFIRAGKLLKRGARWMGTVALLTHKYILISNFKLTDTQNIPFASKSSI